MAYNTSHKVKDIQFGYSTIFNDFLCKPGFSILLEFLPPIVLENSLWRELALVFNGRCPLYLPTIYKSTEGNNSKWK